MPLCTWSMDARIASAVPAALAACFFLAAADRAVNWSRRAPMQPDATTTFHAPRVGLSGVNGAAAMPSCAASVLTCCSAAATVR